MLQHMMDADPNLTGAKGESSSSTLATPQDSTTAITSSYSETTNQTVATLPGLGFSKLHTSYTSHTIHTAKCDECEKRNNSVILRCNDCSRQICKLCIPKLNDGCHLVNEQDIDWNTRGVGGNRGSRGLKGSEKTLRLSSGLTRVAKRQHKKTKTPANARNRFIQQSITKDQGENSLFVSEGKADEQGQAIADDIGFGHLKTDDEALFNDKEASHNEHIDAAGTSSEMGKRMWMGKGKEREKSASLESKNSNDLPPLSARGLSLMSNLAHESAEVFRRNKAHSNTQKELRLAVPGEILEAATILIMTSRQS